MALPPELASLPPPELVEVIAYETRLAQFRTSVVQIFQAAGIDYDVETLETDPAQILLQGATYADILVRQRINEAIQANFLAFATGSDLDHLAQFYDVSRLVDETDDKLRLRIVLAIRGRSTGGTEPRYRSVALGADPRVADAAIYTVGKDPTIHVALFSTDNAGVADQALIATVNAALQDPAVRMVNDRIVVAAASKSVTDIAADVWLLPDASATVIDQMRASLAAAWADAINLGRDVTRSWLTGKLMIDGVQKVEVTAPAQDVIVPFNQAAALGTVTLTNRGRAY